MVSISQNVFDASLAANHQVNELSLVSMQQWTQLETMASNLASMAYKIRLLVAHAKIQSQVMNHSALAQARIQAESERQEIVALAQQTLQEKQELYKSVIQRLVWELVQGQSNESALYQQLIIDGHQDLIDDQIEDEKYKEEHFHGDMANTENINAVEGGEFQNEVN